MVGRKFEKNFDENLKIPYLPCSSKSYSHRFLVLSYVLNRPTKIKNFSFSEDANITLSALYDNYKFKYYNSRFGKTAELILLPKWKTKKEAHYLKDSGSSLRFLIPVFLDGKKHKFEGSERLFERPLDYYEKLFKDEGIGFKKSKNSIEFSGKFTREKFDVDISKSTQFASGMMMAGVNQFDVNYGEGPNIQYIHQTEDAILRMNKSSEKIEVHVPEDMSNRAFFEVLKYFNRLDGDMPKMKAAKSTDNIIGEWLKSNKSIFDLSNNLDLAPVFTAALAIKSAMNGKRYKIIGIKNLAFKESNRTLEIKKVLNLFGYAVSIGRDAIVICERTSDFDYERPIYLNPKEHRIFHMALILSCFHKGRVFIKNKECLKKSHFELYSFLGRMK